jgi:hypothetical protein
LASTRATAIVAGTLGQRESALQVPDPVVGTIDAEPAYTDSQMPFDQLPASRLAAIVEASPRTGTKDALVKLLRGQAALKPQSKLTRRMARVDVEALVRLAPFVD